VKLHDTRALRRFLPLFDDVEGLPAHLPIEAKEGIIRMRGNHRSTPKIWRVVGTLPNERDESAEKQERYAERLELNRLLLKKAVGKHGLTFTDVALGDELNSDKPHSDEVQEEFQDLRNSFATTVWPWTTLQHLATIGVGHALSTRASKGEEDLAEFTVSWQDLAEASVIESQAETALEKWKESQKASPVVQSAVVQPHPRSGRKSKSDASPKKTIDPLVEKLKKDKTLNAHERRLLSCIVDHGAVKNTSFDDVAMEDKTKDAVRSTISLPLLYPEAFRTGILAQHASQGVLLYGRSSRVALGVLPGLELMGLYSPR
jgi:SpoVK/Ycf46/Vps4 family AAA+-type ATPase